MVRPTGHAGKEKAARRRSICLLRCLDRARMKESIRMRLLLVDVTTLFLLAGWSQAAEPANRFPFFDYLTGQPQPSMAAYTPSQLDPRNEANQRRLATSSIR